MTSPRLTSALFLALAASVCRAGDDKVEKSPPPKEVKIQTEDGLTLAADLYEPTSGGEGKPAVVALHAEGGERSMWKDAAKEFQAHGWSLLAVDMRGHGGSRVQKGADPSPSDASGGNDLGPKVAARDPELFGALPKDVAAAIRFLRTTALADGSKIGIVGCGACGAAGLDAASRDAKVAVVLWIGPSQNNFGVAAMEAARKWDGRPVGLMSTERSGHADLDAVAKAFAKSPRTETVILAGPAAAAGEVPAKGEDASAEIVQFVRGWVERPTLTGKTEPEDRSGPGKIVAAQSMDSLGGGAGGLTLGGNEAPPSMEGLVVLACADTKATKLAAGARRLTFRPSKAKDPSLEIVVEQWSGAGWTKLEARTLSGYGAIVLGRDVDTYQIWISPRLLGVKPGSEIAVVHAKIVKGKPNWSGRVTGLSFGSVEVADKSIDPGNPSTWQRQRLF